MIAKNKIYNFLRWSERWTKTDMVYLASGGFWLFLGQVIASLSGLMLAVVFANFLPAETYGTYKYILAGLSIFSMTTLPGIGTALVQAISRDFDGSFKKSLKLKMKWGLIGSTLALLTSGYYFINNDLILSVSFLAAAIFLPLLESYNIYTAALIGKKEFKTTSKYTFVSKILTTTAIITTVFLTKNVVIILLVYLASHTLIRFILYKATLLKLNLNDKVDPETTTYGKHLSLLDFIESIAFNIDKIVLFWFIGPAELAVYAFAIIIPEQIKSYFKNIRSLVLPKFSSRPSSEIKKTIWQKTAKWSLLVLATTVAYIAAAPIIFKLLFPQYLNAVFYSQLFAISMLVISTIPHKSLLKAKQAKKALYIYTAITYTVQIALIAILGYSMGILGVILARITSRATESLLLLILTHRLLNNK